MTEQLRSRLPPDALALLDCQDGRYSEWSTASALAMYALNAGITEDEFVEVVSASDFGYEFATENGRDRSNRLEGRLHKVWEQAETAWNPPLSSGDVRERLSNLLGAVERHNFVGRTATTDRAVALAIVSFGHELGKWTVDASTRELSIRTGVSAGTVSRSLQRLSRTGLMRKGSDNGNGKATTWVLDLTWARPVEEPTNGQTRSHCLSSMGGEVSVIDFDHSRDPPIVNSAPLHPLFLWSGLGQSTGRVWLALTETEWLSATDIADRLGMNRQTVKRALDGKLLPHNLAECSGRRPARYRAIPVSVEDLDSLAAEFGVLDWEQRTRERYDREREGYVAMRRLRRHQTPETPTRRDNQLERTTYN